MNIHEANSFKIIKKGEKKILLELLRWQILPDNTLACGSPRQLKCEMNIKFKLKIVTKIFLDITWKAGVEDCHGLNILSHPFASI